MATGKKTGGRRKGTPNKATSAAAIRAEIAGSGEAPLDYMLRVMRDEAAEPARRDAMAKAAAAYLHPTLSAVAVKQLNPDGSPLAPVVNITIEHPKQPALPSPDEVKSKERTRH
jgi:hypothetical protein